MMRSLLKAQAIFWIFGIGMIAGEALLFAFIRLPKLINLARAFL